MKLAAIFLLLTTCMAQEYPAIPPPNRGLRISLTNISRERIKGALGVLYEHSPQMLDRYVRMIDNAKGDITVNMTTDGSK